MNDVTRPTGAFDAAGQVMAALQGRIDSGELRPGDPVPTIGALSTQYGVATNTASKAIQRLKATGVLTGVAGGPTKVRVQPVLAKRHNDRYHDEKTSVHKPADERASSGTSERDTGLPISDLHENVAHYEVVKATADIAPALNVPVETKVLRRTYTRRHAPGAGISRSISHIPYDLIQSNPDLLDASQEPWPGGTQHQLFTVGVEIDHIDDHVTASMPTSTEQRDYDIPPGIPIIRIRKISYDITGRPVEISDIPAPADRTELIFTTQLERWT